MGPRGQPALLGAAGDASSCVPVSLGAPAHSAVGRGLKVFEKGEALPRQGSKLSARALGERGAGALGRVCLHLLVLPRCLRFSWGKTRQ